MSTSAFLIDFESMKERNLVNWVEILDTDGTVLRKVVRNDEPPFRTDLSEFLLRFKYGSENAHLVDSWCYFSLMLPFENLWGTGDYFDVEVVNDYTAKVRVLIPTKKSGAPYRLIVVIRNKLQHYHFDYETRARTPEGEIIGIEQMYEEEYISEEESYQYNRYGFDESDLYPKILYNGIKTVNRFYQEDGNRPFSLPDASKALGVTIALRMENSSVEGAGYRANLVETADSQILITSVIVDKRKAVKVSAGRYLWQIIDLGSPPPVLGSMKAFLKENGTLVSGNLFIKQNGVIVPVKTIIGG